MNRKRPSGLPLGLAGNPRWKIRTRASSATAVPVGHGDPHECDAGRRSVTVTTRCSPTGPGSPSASPIARVRPRSRRSRTPRRGGGDPRETSRPAPTGRAGVLAGAAPPARHRPRSRRGFLVGHGAVRGDGDSRRILHAQLHLGAGNGLALRDRADAGHGHHGLEANGRGRREGRSATEPYVGRSSMYPAARTWRFIAPSSPRPGTWKRPRSSTVGPSSAPKPQAARTLAPAIGAPVAASTTGPVERRCPGSAGARISGSPAPRTSPTPGT